MFCLKAKRIAAVGVLAALGFGLSYIELMLPSPGIPGAKLGLSNLAVITAIYILTPFEALWVWLIKTLLSFALFGSLTGLIYSLCGGILSFAVMTLLVKANRFSPVGVSAAGGVVHNLGQLAAAVLLLGTGVVYYIPALLISGTVFGIAVGAAASAVLGVLKRLSRRA